MKRRRMYVQKKKQKFDAVSFFAGLIVFCIPLMLFCGQANLVMRMGEVYEYSLDASGIMENTTLATNKQDTVNAFSSFMMHKSPELKLIESADYDPQDLFSRKDKEAMAGARRILDVMMVIGMAAFLLTALSYFLLIRWRIKGTFMSRFKISCVVFVIIDIANAIINLTPQVRNAVYGTFLPVKFPDGDNLVLLLGDAFPRQVTMFETLIGAIMMAILAYVTWSVAGRKKIFRGP